MKYTIKGNRTEDVVCQEDEITFGRRPEWCDATWTPLKLSLLRPRQWFEGDRRKKTPVIVWICGGAFTHVDKNVWSPELQFFAKHGYAVASIEYSTSGRAHYPMQIEDIRQGIRYLKAHAEEFHFDKEKIVIMGESAGAYLAALEALTASNLDLDIGDYKEESCAVNAIVALYPLVNRLNVPSNVVIDAVTDGMPDLVTLIDENTPPFMIVHGLNDCTIPCSESEYLYDALEKQGTPCDLYLIEDCNHADTPIYQTEIKEKILDFINQYC